MENLGFMWFFKAGLGFWTGVIVVKVVGAVGLAVLSTALEWVLNK